jgi:hypothetical protein
VASVTCAAYINISSVVSTVLLERLDCLPSRVKRAYTQKKREHHCVCYALACVVSLSRQASLKKQQRFLLFSFKKCRTSLGLFEWPPYHVVTAGFKLPETTFFLKHFKTRARKSFFLFQTSLKLFVVFMFCFLPNE